MKAGATSPPIRGISFIYEVPVRLRLRTEGGKPVNISIATC